jgi:4-azaleucine resistance transporter AzlC
VPESAGFGAENRPSPAASFTIRGLLRGARRGLVLAPSDVVFGLLFGVLSRQAGLSLGEALAMSALVNAGSSQVVALGMWGTPVPILAIVATTLLVNLRHVLMGLTLHPWYSKLPAHTAYGSAFFLTDESWALTTVEFQQREADGAFLVGVGLVLFVGWVGWTTVGAITGAAIHDPASWGLDFAFVAVFLALLTSLAKGRRDLVPWILAAGASIAANRLLPGSWYVLIGAVAGSLPAVLRKSRD